MRFLGTIGAAGLFLGVALGAFAAHALKGHLSEQMQSVFETAVRYQMYHSLAIILAASLLDRSPMFQVAGIFYIAGIILFSGSLYILATTGIRWFGAITPLGGLSFLIGHAVMFITFLRL